MHLKRRWKTLFLVDKKQQDVFSVASFHQMQAIGYHKAAFPDIFSGFEGQ
ncbi:MAG: hypothetical protein ACLR6J_10075 [Parabacteroides merdae]